MSYPPPPTPSSPNPSPPRTPSHEHVKMEESPCLETPTPPYEHLKIEELSSLESHNRFRNVVKSYLPGRPDLESDSSPPRSSSRAFASSTPTRLPETSPTMRIKEEEESTPPSSDDTISSLDISQHRRNTTTSVLKPSHLVYLTDEEYTARIAQANRNRERLGPAMKQSLALTAEMAAKRRKRSARREFHNSDTQPHLADLSPAEQLEVRKSIDRLDTVLKGISIEKDRKALMEALEKRDTGGTKTRRRGDSVVSADLVEATQFKEAVGLSSYIKSVMNGASKK